MRLHVVPGQNRGEPSLQEQVADRELLRQPDRVGADGDLDQNADVARDGGERRGDRGLADEDAIEPGALGVPGLAVPAGDGEHDAEPHAAPLRRSGSSRRPCSSSCRWASSRPSSVTLCRTSRSMPSPASSPSRAATSSAVPAIAVATARSICFAIRASSGAPSTGRHPPGAGVLLVVAPQDRREALAREVAVLLHPDVDDHADARALRRRPRPRRARRGTPPPARASGRAGGGSRCPC